MRLIEKPAMSWPISGVIGASCPRGRAVAVQPLEVAQLGCANEQLSVGHTEGDVVVLPLVLAEEGGEDLRGRVVPEVLAGGAAGRLRQQEAAVGPVVGDAPQPVLPEDELGAAGRDVVAVDGVGVGLAVVGPVEDRGAVIG